MKIQHPLLIQAVGVAGPRSSGSWGERSRTTSGTRTPSSTPKSRGSTGQRYIYAFFHEVTLFPAYYWNWPEMHILISDHRDGELITQVVKRLGFSVVRGSTTRGGVRALREMSLRIDRGHLCVTPDGPRGPRRSVHQGVAYLASRTGLPIVGAGMAFKKTLASQELGPVLRAPAVQPGRVRRSRGRDRSTRRRPRDHRVVPLRSRAAHARRHDRSRGLGRTALKCRTTSRTSTCIAKTLPICSCAKREVRVTCRFLSRPLAFMARSAREGSSR